MIRVYQSTFSDKETGEKGNCWAACLSSLLEIPIKDCLDVNSLPENTHWAEATQEFLSEFGLDYEVYNYTIPPKGYSIMIGRSPRGEYGHSCIAFNGKLFHDPHPSNAGVVNVSQFWALIPAAPKKEEWKK